MLSIGRLNRGETTLHRRLILFFVLLSVFLILGFVALLSLFGITGEQTEGVRGQLGTELSILSDEIADEFGALSLGGIAIAEDIAARCDEFFAAEGIGAGELSDHPELLEALLSQQMQTLINVISSRHCGGVFLMLDATVRTDGEDSESAKSGIFLKKTQPTATNTVGVDLHYLRGPAQIGRDHGIMLLGQWHMEFDVAGQEFFTAVMDTARENPDLPLSRLYYWSDRVTLKGNSEAGFLLCVPLRSADGTIFGLCGIEVSDRLFKSLYTPDGGEYENIFTLASPISEGTLHASKGLIAGNSYLTGTRWTNDLVFAENEDGFDYFTTGTEVYGGLCSPLRLYPGGSPYEGEKWGVALLMPREKLDAAVRGSLVSFFLTAALVLLASIVASVFISHRYLRPVKEALHSIRTKTASERTASPYLEINDLFDFLERQDIERAEEIGRLNAEKDKLKTRHDRAQDYLEKINDERLSRVDEDGYEAFLQCLHTLTPKEREIFDFYLAGHKAREIMSMTGVNQNTMKYHNRNIYSKLGVTSRKQLLDYAALMQLSEERTVQHDGR